MKNGHLVNMLQSENFDCEVLVAGEEGAPLRVPGAVKLHREELTGRFYLVLSTSPAPDATAGAEAAPVESAPVESAPAEGSTDAGDAGAAGDD